MDDKKGITFPQHAACPGAVRIPTEKEERALSAMRRINGQVRLLKERLKGLEASGALEEIPAVKNDLAVLKKAWNQWEKRRK
ncbi:MAG: hypothetical protein P8Y00_05535, partial [Deltaproteobacteria bacterium]